MTGMMTSTALTGTLAVAMLSAAAPAGSGEETGAAAPDTEWEILFDGTGLDKWEYRPGGWHIEEGVLAWGENAGFIWTKKPYGDFVLELEFKLADKTNSGVFIRAGDKRKPVQTSLEIQILDSHGKETVGKHDCGAIYDALAPAVNTVKAPGEWNRMSITARGSMVYVSLNGTPVVSADLERWKEPGKNPDGTENKFKTPLRDFPRKGYIGLQDHKHPVWYRNIRILPLDARPEK